MGDCPNSSTGEHNWQIQPVITEQETVMVRVCLLCQARD
jgi:hypothetical protein